jgi:hypothetical protein
MSINVSPTHHDSRKTTAGDPLITRHRRADGACHILSLFLSRYLTPIALLVFGAPFLGLLFYASMNFDDFAKAASAYNCAVHVHGTLTEIAWNVYTTRTARWVTSLLQGLLMSKFDLVTCYGWLLLLVVLTNIAALSYFFASFLRVSATRALIAGGAFYAAWLAGVASPGENVFWLSGATEYQLPIATLLVLAGLLCRSKHTIFSYVALAILAIAVPGQHEIAGALLLVCLLAGVAAARVLKLPAPQWWLSLGLAVLSLAAVMFSPAKVSALAHEGNDPSVVINVLSYARSAVSAGIDWVLNPAVLLCAFCLPVLLWTSEQTSAAPEFLPPRWLALPGLGAMSFLIIEFAGAGVASASSYGQLPPRAVGCFQFAFWLLLVCVIVVGVPEITRIRFSPSSRIGILTLFALSLLGSGNFRSAEKDLRGPARPYWKSSVARLKQRGDSLQFEPLPIKPVLFRETFLSPDKTCTANQCMAFYLGASTLVVRSPGESPVFLQHPWGCASRP